MTDDLIMLLSTDWFLPHWADIGIDLAEDRRIGIQQGCRQIINQILNGAESLFYCNFSEERKEETRSKFLELLRAWNAEAEVTATYQEWLGLSRPDLNAAWTCSHLNQKISLGDIPIDIPELDREVRAAVLKVWDQYALKPSTFRDICLNSKTEWDAYTRTALGEPSSLASQLHRVLLDHRLREFWIHLSQSLTSHQLQDLVSWYRLMIRSMSHEDRPDLIPSYFS
jgi:hypothetical protein